MVTNICIGGINNFVQVSFILLRASVSIGICTFIGHNRSPGLKYCNASISYGIDCETSLGVYVGSSTSNMVTTAPLDTITKITEYCYNITVTAQNRKVNQIVIEGLVDLSTLSSPTSASSGNAISLKKMVFPENNHYYNEC